MADAHKNFAASLVATAPSPASSGTSLVVTTGEGTKFPTAPFNATIWPASVAPTTANAEIVRVTAITTDTLTITRAQEGSSARTVVVGDQIAATITAKTLTDVETAVPTGIGYALVSSATFSTSVNALTTLFSITGLDGDTDSAYELTVIGGTTGGTQGNMAFNFNAAATTWDYYCAGNRTNSVANTGLSIVAAAASAFLFGTAATNETYDSFTLKLVIKASKTTGNTKRHYTGQVRFGGNGHYQVSGEWGDTTTNVTSIQVRAGTNSGGAQTVTGRYWLTKLATA